MKEGGSAEKHKNKAVQRTDNENILFFLETEEEARQDDECDLIRSSAPGEKKLKKPLR